MKKSGKIILFSLLFLAVGIATGYFFGYTFGFNKEHTLLVQKISEIQPIQLNNSNYHFINPLLAYVTPSASQEPQFMDLKNKISDLINTEKNNGLIQASVYMSELNKGRWIGVNSDDTYPPASMYKVVVMIGYLAAEENTPGLVNDTFLYTKSIDDQTKNSGFDFLQVGQTYTVGDLINKMIIDSDNDSELLLEDHLDQNSINSFLHIFNITGISSDGYFVISPKQFSLFFRTLYNATSLSPDLSEQALDTLSQTTFNDGLVAGVPQNIVVAHKFGYLTEPGNIVYLHDCGIIYRPNDPYLLCVMTEGNNEDELKSLIKNISSLVYQSTNQ